MAVGPLSPKQLVEQYPHLKGLVGFLEALVVESDRGKVLISTGYLEEQLKEVLLAFVLEKPEATALLSGANAPLGTFSSRISASYVLGLISEDEHHDLQITRRIRNDFAHKLETRFETPSVADRCSQLRLKATNIPPKTRIAGAQFTTAATTIINHLTIRPRQVAAERRQCRV